VSGISLSNEVAKVLYSLRLENYFLYILPVAFEAGFVWLPRTTVLRFWRHQVLLRSRRTPPGRIQTMPFPGSSLYSRGVRKRKAPGNETGTERVNVTWLHMWDQGAKNDGHAFSHPGEMLCLNRKGVSFAMAVSFKLLLLGHRSLIKTKTQIAVINMVNERILIINLTFRMLNIRKCMLLSIQNVKFITVKMRLFTMFITAVCVSFLKVPP